MNFTIISANGAKSYSFLINWGKFRLKLLYQDYKSGFFNFCPIKIEEIIKFWSMTPIIYCNSISIDNKECEPNCLIGWPESIKL